VHTFSAYVKFNLPAMQDGTEKSGTYKLHADNLLNCGFISVDT